MIFRLLIVALLAGCSQLPGIAQLPIEPVTSIATEELVRPTTSIALSSASISVERVTSTTSSATIIASPTSSKMLINPTTKVGIKADAISLQLTNAVMAFELPTAANVADTIQATLVIHPRGTIVPSGSITSVIQVSKIISATILAPDFKVLALAPERQALSEIDVTKWQWELSNALPGKHDIHLSINAIVTVDNDRAERLIKTFESTVTVEITPQQWLFAMLKEHMQWIWSTLLLPVGMWLWRLFKKGDRK